MDTVKAEIKPEIKTDPSSTTTKGLADIEAYEDDIDTSFPDPAAQAWLVKVPEDLWKAWAEVYKDAPDDTPIEVGKMRIYHQPPEEQADTKKQKIQIRLHQNVPQLQGVGKQYNVAVTTSDYSNVVVFSEKDLPGHKPQPFGRSNRQANSKPTGIPSRDQRYGNTTNTTSSKYGRSRSAIPKQTSLAPRIQHEASATPVMNADYEASFARTWAAHMAPKSHTTYLGAVDRGMHPGLSSNLNTFSSFGLSARPGKGNKRGTANGAAAGRSKDKNVRVSKPELLDALQGCFRRYRYWPLKALRIELRQPEAWIKEVLEEVAVLVRSGDFAMNLAVASHQAE
ncbi:hypothetical protein B0A55_13428 [Friedmanniomyces simplex]|uniref:Uncharacterized protein n=1 Tax=Friedmanniomyces simplex TaxID=329884 RepID=A0A4U0VZ73_9PEZI|nr:hypothetical protein B0A55_13428 [Friedmanniomyces simplex]